MLDAGSDEEELARLKLRRGLAVKEGCVSEKKAPSVTSNLLMQSSSPHILESQG